MVNGGKIGHHVDLGRLCGVGVLTCCIQLGDELEGDHVGAVDAAEPDGGQRLGLWGS